MKEFHSYVASQLSEPAVEKAYDLFFSYFKSILRKIGQGRRTQGCFVELLSILNRVC